MRQPAPHRLRRSRSERIIAGVGGGISTYLAIDPLLTRLVLIFLALSGFGIPLYLLLWMIMPVEPATRSNGYDASFPTHDGSVQAAGSGNGSTSRTFATYGSGPGRVRFDPMTGQPLEPEEELPVREFGQERTPDHQRPQRDGTIGMVLIIVGTFLIMMKLLPSIAPFMIPALLIGAGLLLLRRANREA
jgi:phage shock protein C